MQEQQPTALKKPFHQKQAIALGIVLIVIGGLSILFNVVDLCIGTGLPDPWMKGSFNSDGTISRTMSHPSLGVAAYGLWAGVVYIAAGICGILAGLDRTTCRVTAFLVLTVIGTLVSIAQIVIAGIGAEETDDYRSYYINLYYKDCKSVVCREVTALLAMAILLLLLGVGALIACLWSLVLCCISKECCAPAPIAATEDTPPKQQTNQANTTSQQQSRPSGAADTQKTFSWSDGRTQKVSTLYDESNDNASAPSQAYQM